MKKLAHRTQPDKFGPDKFFIFWRCLAVFFISWTFLLSCQSQPPQKFSQKFYQEFSEELPSKEQLKIPAGKKALQLAANPHSNFSRAREKLFFKPSKAWQELAYHPQITRPATAKSGKIVLRAYKKKSRTGPSLQLIIYEQNCLVPPRQYLKNLRQNKTQIRELKAPEVRRFGHRHNYGYMLYFMSKKYLYQEFILFVAGQAVHLVFQSPHDQLVAAAALQSFYRQVHSELERGLYFRKS